MDVQKVWKDYGIELKRFLLSRVSVLEDAEDLLQEILIKTHNNLSTVKDPSKLKPWLYKIARNILIDYYRKKRPEVSGQEIPELIAFSEENLSPTNPVFKDMSVCIKPFLTQLPEMYRQAIEETDLEGTSQKEFAEKTGVSYSTVKSRVQRGRAMLGSLFRECCSYQLDVRGNIMNFEERSECCLVPDQTASNLSESL